MSRTLAAIVGIALLLVGGLVVAGQYHVSAGAPRVSQAVTGETTGVEKQSGLQTVSLGVRKMDCASCAYILRRALEDVDGVVSAKVSYGDETAVVTYDPARCGIVELVAATERIGFPSKVIQ